MELKLAVIGCLSLVYDLLLEGLKLLPVRTVAICGSKDEMEKIGLHYNCGNKYTNYKALLEREKPDVVLLFPTEGDAEAMVKDCLLAGTYVFAERPVCQSLAAAEDLVKLQEKTGCYVMARYTRRCATAYQMAREIITRPEFGKTEMFIANYYTDPGGDTSTSEKVFVWNHISHIIDAMLYLTGDMELLHAEKVIRDEHHICYNMSFRTHNGAIGLIQSGSTLCYEYPMERVLVTGNKRCVIVENIRNLTYHRPAPVRKHGDKAVLDESSDALVWKQNYGQLSSFGYYGIEGCLEEITDAALHRREPSFHAADVLKVVKILEELENKAVQYE